MCEQRVKKWHTLEPEILYLAYLTLEVTSPAIVGLNAFLASPNLP